MKRAVPVRRANTGSWPVAHEQMFGFIARTLMANGIDVCWPEREMKAGDSLHQKLDDGSTGSTRRGPEIYEEQKLTV